MLDRDGSIDTLQNGTENIGMQKQLQYSFTTGRSLAHSMRNWKVCAMLFHMGYAEVHEDSEQQTVLPSVWSLSFDQMLLGSLTYIGVKSSWQQPIYRTDCNWKQLTVFHSDCDMDPNQTLGIFECSDAELTPKFYMKNVPVWRTESPMGLFVGPVSQWHIWYNG